MTVEAEPWDPSERLGTLEAQQVYLEDALKDGDPALIVAGSFFRALQPCLLAPHCVEHQPFAHTEPCVFPAHAQTPFQSRDDDADEGEVASLLDRPAVQFLPVPGTRAPGPSASLMRSSASSGVFPSSGETSASPASFSSVRSPSERHWNKQDRGP